MFDRWTIYEMLKSNPKVLTMDNINKIETMNAKELKEGCIEYLLTQIRKPNKELYM